MKTAQEMQQITTQSADPETKLFEFKQKQLEKWLNLNIDHIMDQIEYTASIGKYSCELVNVYYKRDYYRVLYLVDKLDKAGYKCDIDMSPENREEFYTVNVNWEK